MERLAQPLWLAVLNNGRTFSSNATATLPYIPPTDPSQVFSKFTYARQNYLDTAMKLLNNPVNDSENSSQGAVGALILIPVVIAGAAALVAIKATGYWDSIGIPCRKIFCFLRRNNKNKKRNRSDEGHSTAQSYPDSLGDLESIYPASETHPLRDCSPSKDTPAKGWHPSRPSRLSWSFGPALKLPNQNHYELSSVQRPSPCVSPLERSQFQYENPADPLILLGHPQKVRASL